MTKRILIIAAIVLAVCIAVCVVFTLKHSPDSLSLQGEYTAVEIGTGATLRFDGDRVCVTYMSAGLEVYSVSGSYKISGDSITLSLNGNDAEQAVMFDGTHSFALGDGYIVFDGIVYKSVN